MNTSMGMSLSGGPMGSTITGGSIYGTSFGASSNTAKTNPAHPAGGHAVKSIAGIQLPVLIAMGAIAWWLWRVYD